MKEEPDLKGNESSGSSGVWVVASLLTLPSAVLVGITAEVLSQDPLTRPNLPLPLFLVWFSGAWIVFAGVSAWTYRLWKRILPLTGYIYAVTAFVALFIFLPDLRTLRGMFAGIISSVIIGWLVITGLIALAVATFTAIAPDGKRSPSGPEEPPPSDPTPNPTMRERFRERAERFSRTRLP